MASFLPSLNGLRAFEAAARHLSFTRAAAELNVTQTAVSHQIRRLEEQLAVKLFDRQTRALTLTPEGEAYLPEIRAAFADLRTATERLLRPRRQRILTVSTTPTFGAKWLVPRLPAFQEAHPGIEVRISTSLRLVDLTRDGIDVAIRYGRGSWPNVRADWLMAEDLFPVCSPALLAGGAALRTPADLAHHTLLHVNYQRDEWQLWLTAAGIGPEERQELSRRGLTFDQAFMVVQAAIDGVGVAIGHRSHVQADIAAGRLVAPFALTLPTEAGFYVVTAENPGERPWITAFRIWLLQNAPT
jgi:LysR family glycine cleavage system transcriptional activator